ncbi:MAG TPA: glycosyltransferase, partial [Pirellulaceae bacterium]
NRPTIAFVGKVGARKRPHLLVEALAELHRQGLEAQAVFVGPLDERDAAYAARFSDAIRRHNLASHVLVTGFRTDVDEWLRAADVFCLPSEHEGMPGALVEALASGLPSVVTPFSGAAEVIVHERYGRIIEPRGEPLANALLSYLDSPAHLGDCRQACRERAERFFSATAAFRAHVALFQRILAGKSPRAE